MNCPKSVTRHRGWIDRAFGYKASDATELPARANNKICMATTNQRCNLEDDAGTIKATLMFIPEQSVVVFPSEISPLASVGTASVPTYGIAP